MIEICQKYELQSDGLYKLLGDCFINIEVLDNRGIILILNKFKSDKKILKDILRSFKNEIILIMFVWKTYIDLDLFLKYIQICGEYIISELDVYANFNKYSNIMFEESKEHYSLDRLDEYVEILKSFEGLFDINVSKNIRMIDIEYDKIREMAYDSFENLEEEENIYYYDEDEDYDRNEIVELFDKLNDVDLYNLKD